MMIHERATKKQHIAINTTIMDNEPEVLMEGSAEIVD